MTLMATYARLPVAFVRGEGVWLYDSDGRAYLDALAGIAVCGLGHAHPAVTRAIQEQAGHLIHTSNLYRVPLQEALGERLCRLSGLDAAFFCNSGAEANEAAIKLARLYGHQRGVAEPKILVFSQAFHGRTLAALTATGNFRIQEGFGPLVSGFVRVPYGDLAAARAALAADPAIVAVLAEPIQGEGGVRPAPAGFLRGLRTLCDEHAALLMFDEVQTGIGRSGKFLAYQHEEGLLPDVLSLAKGLGNGVPIGALLARAPVAALFGPGKHGTTFGGGPLVCAAALAVLETMEAEDIPTQAAQQGQRLREHLQRRLGGHPLVEEIRGLGLMLGVVLRRKPERLVERALDAGLLINVTAERVIRLLPPLIIREAEIALLTDILSTLLEDES
ncbi:aspartate aminotransferase family protein [Acidithiobacillus caldus]|uniref:Acetylornithine aminotransferase n=2 Tax=Acidithiobacillus caldus TaxID=33059 RepID=F9ZRT4_ACICS|nr:MULTISPECIES: aspartate aminotransferase family protein [Acidithiobacillus]AEK59099.1 Acetylornithine aminotransferase [Acidithiobacillus caldus SM-1]AUW33491.1 aspartate aminotransferase family protein [Acidithiobacillus caldus]MBU2802363.1 aspartate aminotransferase family protein [Acidithiobacillus caldus]MCE5420733.1 aspartate aminotransferase family protein [Acidithiobacillus sp.]MCY0871205.1 aspartate aminotransferase family protein [Acidithiobacillus caldus]